MLRQSTFVSYKVCMKVLLINGSPHLKGCTFTALNEVAKTLNQEGIETEMIHVGNQEIRGCIACGTCRKQGQCIFNDLVNETRPKLQECDGIVIGSPVYYASPNGTLISFLDRLFYSKNIKMRMKVGASVVSARRGGNTASFDVLNKYFTISEMPIVSSQYWNMVHGNNVEEVQQDLEGLQTMRTLGRNMAFLIKSIQLGKEQNLLSENEKKVATNFIR